MCSQRLNIVYTGHRSVEVNQVKETQIIHWIAM